MKTNRNRWFRTNAGRIAIIFLLLLFIPGMVTTMITAEVKAAVAELLTPRPGATVIGRNKETHLVMRLAGNGKTIRVQVEKSGAMLEPVETMEGAEHIYLHFRLPLIPGLNTFTIVPGDQRLELTYQPLQGRLPLNMKNFYLFHQDGQLPESCVDCHDLQDTKTINLIGLKQQTSCAACHKNLIDKYAWKHSTTVNLQCLSCHQQYIKPWRIGFREEGIDDTCFACHTGKKAWQLSKHRHGALIGGCTICHNPHEGQYRYQLWAEGSLELCVVCHDDKLNLVDKDDRLPYVHGIISGKGCVACHDPHASDEEFMLRQPVNNLCISCHQILASGAQGGHPVAGHPVAAPRERRRPGRKLTCIGCHDPHGSVQQNLLVETKMGGRLCRVCHKR